METIAEIRDSLACCGCETCGLVCPVKAITFAEDEEGFLYPKISADLCVKCGKCLKACPVSRASNPSGEVLSRFPPATFGGYALDSRTVSNCASGGIATSIYRDMLGRGGHAYGVVYNDDFTGTVFRAAKSGEDLRRFSGSKYAQARKHRIFAQIQQDLRDGTEVAFVGLPCEAAALKGFLNREYENLLLVQLVCMGVTSDRVLRDYLASVGVGDIADIRERAYLSAWETPYFQIERTDGSGITRPYDTTNYAYAYLAYGRPSCYCCRFKGTERAAADIVLGDLWGAERQNPNYQKNGMSLVIAVSEKGLRFLKSMDNIRLFPLDSYDIGQNNPFFLRVRNDLDRRRKFAALYQTHSLPDACRKAMTSAEKLKWTVGGLLPHRIYDALYPLYRKIKTKR